MERHISPTISTQKEKMIFKASNDQHHSACMSLCGSSAVLFDHISDLVQPKRRIRISHPVKKKGRQCRKHGAKIR